jgi:hypothetical protein
MSYPSAVSVTYTNINLMESMLHKPNADYQKIAKLSLSESFLKIPSLSSSSVAPDLSSNSERHSKSGLEELNKSMKQLHAVLVNFIPGAQLAEYQSSQDLSRIALTLHNYVSTLKENICRAPQSSRDQESAESEAVVKADSGSLDVLDKVFSNKAVTFDAGETQALASVVIGAIRNSTNEELRKANAVLQNNYVRLSEEVLELRRLLRKQEDCMQQLSCQGHSMFD